MHCRQQALQRVAWSLLSDQLLSTLIPQKEEKHHTSQAESSRKEIRKRDVLNYTEITSTHLKMRLFGAFFLWLLGWHHSRLVTRDKKKGVKLVKITDWFGLEGSFKIIYFQPPAIGRRHSSTRCLETNPNSTRGILSFRRDPYPLEAPWDKLKFSIVKSLKTQMRLDL